jgi:hypothetical protein
MKKPGSKTQTQWMDLSAGAGLFALRLRVSGGLPGFQLDSCRLYFFPAVLICVFQKEFTWDTGMKT